MTVTDPLKIMQEVNGQKLPELSNGQDLNQVLANSNELNKTYE